VKIFFIFLLFFCSIYEIPAQMSIDSLQNVLKNVNNDNDRLTVLEKMYSYYRPTNMDSAQITINIALSIARKANNTYAETRLLYKLGHLLRAMKSDYKTALETYLKALKIAETNKDTAVWSEIYYGIGRIQADGGHNLEAEQAFEESIRWARTDLDKYDGIEVYAVHLANQKKFEQAEKMFLSLIPLVKQSKELNNKTLRMYNNIGEFYKSFKADSAKSLFYYREGAKQALPDPKVDFMNYVIDCGSLSNTFFSLKDYKNAKLYALKVTPYRTQSKDNIKKVVSNAYKRLFYISKIEGDYKKAVLYADSAIMLRDSLMALVNSDSLKRETYKLDAAFKLERKQKEVELLAQKQKTQIAWTIAASSIALLLLALALVIQRNKKKVEQQKTELTAINATKDKLFSIIAHDLRAPIGTLKTYLEMTDFGLMSQAQFSTASQKLTNNVNALFQTLDNLLQWAYSQLKGIKTQPEVINLNEVVSEELQFLYETAQQKNVTIINNIEPETTVFADKNQVGLVIRNTVSNALKFTNSGGEIILQSSNTEGGKMSLTISDNGIGIPQDIQNQLFTINEKASRRGTAQEKGQGLGLILAKEMMEANEGSLKIESVENKGTTVYLELPISG
jgi:signal transduction histidine kinase